MRADIEAAQQGGAPAGAGRAAPAAAPARRRGARRRAAAGRPVAAITAPHTLVPHTTMRKVIARRLTEAKQTVPHFYVSMDIELDALLKLRAELNARSAKDGPGAFKLSVNDLLIKAAAITLRRIPKVNAAWTDDGVALYDDVDISVAVSIPDGLITPIIRQADRKGLAAISNEMKDLAGAGEGRQAEAGGIPGRRLLDLQHGHVRRVAISPPSSTRRRPASSPSPPGSSAPVVKDGALAIATVMTCTLSVDHRVVDGALGAEWLAEFRRIVEDPLSLML